MKVMREDLAQLRLTSLLASSFTIPARLILDTLLSLIHMRTIGRGEPLTGSSWWGDSSSTREV